MAYFYVLPTEDGSKKKNKEQMKKRLKNAEA